MIFIVLTVFRELYMSPLKYGIVSKAIKPLNTMLNLLNKITFLELSNGGSPFDDCNVFLASRKQNRIRPRVPLKIPKMSKFHKNSVCIHKLI